jgi:hypothetical protein
VDAELWARVAALEGEVLPSAGGRWFRVEAVDGAGVLVRTLPSGQSVRLSRRALEQATPFVAAGEPLPPRFGVQVPRLTAVLRAAGVGPPA